MTTACPQKKTRLIFALLPAFVVFQIVFQDKVGCISEETGHYAEMTMGVDRLSEWGTLVSQSIRLMHEQSFCSGRNAWDCGNAYCTTHKRELVRYDTEPATKCKTLWFVGMSQADFDKILPVSMNSYATLYVAALEAIHYHSSDVIQPVLMLNAYGNSSSNAEESAVAKFAMSRGAVVVNVVDLSMQTTIDTLYPIVPDGHRVGPFMRMDIPYIIRKKNMFNMSGICERHALYTDSDVLFPNPITHQDMQWLKGSMGNSLVMYGREFGMHPHIFNTGVMLIDVPAFEAELPKIINFGRKRGKGFDAFDQGWMNEYFSQKNKKHKRALLSIYWNWKAYWAMMPSFLEDVKIIHYHGPKPGRCLENIASCDPPDRSCGIEAYMGLVRHGICCDYGGTAWLALDLTKKLSNVSE